MTFPPWLALSLLCALTLALAYQIMSKRWGWRVVAYWVLIALGWLAGEALAESMGWGFSRFGDLRLIPDLAGALVAISVLWFLGV